MSRNRSYIIVLVLLTVLAGLSGILSNIASSTLPDAWQPYLWLAWPLFIILMLITIGLVIWQIRLEREPPSPAESAEPPRWVSQLADAIRDAVHPAPSSEAFPVPVPRPPEPSQLEGDVEYDTFISYSSADRDWVRGELLPRLEAAGLKVCIDFRDFEPGAPSVTEMERAVHTSRKTLLVLTPSYLESAWAEFETLMLQTLDPASRERRLIPLLKVRCDLPPRICYLAYVDLTEPEDWDIAWARLLTAVGTPALQAPVLSRGKTLEHNLPPRGEFVGREAEKAELHKALQRSRLVCIEGIGGIGKTALALEVAHECLQASQGERPADGIATFEGFMWTTAKDRDLSLDYLLDVMARKLSYPDITKEPAKEKRDTICRLLQAKPHLLIVDNYETITDERVRDFLLKLPEPSKALVISREREQLEAEVILLKGLPETESLALMRSVGKRLKLRSIERVADYELSPLCQATGGVPLAIKWAVGQIGQRGQSLDRVLAALDVVTADVFDHMFARSWELLSGEGRRVLMVMPLFATSPPRAGIEAVSDVHDFALDEALGQLVEMFLVDATDELEEKKRRYGLHPLTRRFASAELTNSGDFRWKAQERFVKYFAAMVEEQLGKRLFYAIQDHRRRFPLVTPEIDDITVAWEIIRDEGERLQNWKELLASLVPSWALMWEMGWHKQRIQLGLVFIPSLIQLGSFQLAGELLREVIGSCLVLGIGEMTCDEFEEIEETEKVEEIRSTIVEIEKIDFGALAARVQGKYTEADHDPVLRLINLLDLIAEQIKSTDIVGFAHWFRAWILDRQGDYDKAERTLLSGAIGLLRSATKRTGDSKWADLADSWEARAEARDGTLETSEYAELDIEVPGHIRVWCELICKLADVLLHQKVPRRDLATAQSLYEARIRLSEDERNKLRYSDVVPWGYVRLGRLYYWRYMWEARNELKTAEETFRTARVLASKRTETLGEAHAVFGLARVKKEKGDISEAQDLAQESLELFKQHSAFPMMRKARALLDELEGSTNRQEQSK